MLGDAKLEKLVILRMNRRFMEFMRQNYKHLIKNQLDKQFGSSLLCTIAGGLQLVRDEVV